MSNYNFVLCDVGITIVKSGLLHSGVDFILEISRDRYGPIKEYFFFSRSVQRLHSDHACGLLRAETSSMVVMKEEGSIFWFAQNDPKSRGFAVV